MEPRLVDRRKIYLGVLFLCMAALVMLADRGGRYPSLQVVWIFLAGVGLFFYLWGRFFSRGSG